MDKNFHIAFLGDISLNNGYALLEKQNKNPFNNVLRIFDNVDFVIGNLESGLIGDDGTNKNKSPVVVAEENSFNLLKEIPLDVALLANNHIYDGLYSGFRKTINKLKQLSISFLGVSDNINDYYKPYYINYQNLRICILNYVSNDTNPKVPITSKVFLNIFEEKKVIADIHKFKVISDYIIINLHWGGKMENGYFPHPDQRKLAHKLIKSGADLIVGHHSHTIQPIEKYKGKYIFYSLGNFCFDSICDGKTISPLLPRKKKGVVLKVIFDNESINYKLSFIRNINLNIFEDQSFQFAFYCRQILFKLVMTKPIWYIYKFKFAIINPVVQYFFYYPTTLKEKLNSIKIQKIVKLFR